MTPEPLRVLIVDDSASNRRTIAEILESSEDIEVVGKAADGDEALRLAMSLRPDVITLDLEMPRVDGFTFLRWLMAKLPTPVIIISMAFRMPTNQAWKCMSGTPKRTAGYPICASSAM